MVYQFLLDGMMQDCCNVLLNVYGNFKIIKSFNFFYWNQQIICIQFGNIFVIDYWEDISFKVFLYGIIIIIRLFCFCRELCFGYCFEGVCIIMFGFKFFNFCLFFCIRVNILSQKFFGFVMVLFCVRKRNCRVNINREEFLFFFEVVSYLLVFGIFWGNVKEYIKVISQFVFFFKGFCIFCFDISQ